jgi:hypothetical protein
MTVLFRVKIENELHRVSINLPDDQDPNMLPDLEAFAVRTAQLEHSGYIPRGAVSAVDAIRPRRATPLPPLANTPE